MSKRLTSAQQARNETQRAQSQLVDRDRVIAAQATLIELLTDALLGRQAATDTTEESR